MSRGISNFHIGYDLCQIKFSWAESGWSLISRPTSVQPFNDNERGCMIEGCLHMEQINTKCKCGKVAEDELKQMERTFILVIYTSCHKSRRLTVTHVNGEKSLDHNATNYVQQIDVTLLFS